MSVQPRDEADLTAAQSVAICEYPLKKGHGFADYPLHVEVQQFHKPESFQTMDQKPNRRHNPGAIENGSSMTTVDDHRVGCHRFQNLRFGHSPAGYAITLRTKALANFSDPLRRDQYFELYGPEIVLHG
jgi:hypothetical protein